MAEQFDVIVIGSGPGGYTTAIRATQLGFKTAIVEREKLGGICLNWGCIPTKALLRTAEVFRNFQHAKEYGLAADNVRFDSKAVIERSRGVANKLSSGISFLMKKNKITVLMGNARLEKGGAAPKVIVKTDKGEETYSPKHVILATGARAREMPDLGMKADGKRLWTYREAMTPPEWPQSLLVFGSGAIGIEFASFYQALGVKVTVVELLDRILPVEDAEVSAFALKQFKKLGLEFRIGAKASNVIAGPNGVTATIDTNGQKETLSASHAIIAVGIVGNVENLGLEALGVKVDRTHVVTDGLGKTNVLGLYAIGDVTGPPWLAHKAGHEGTACIEAIAGQHPHALDVTKIPGCTYSHPQIASIGLTEARAKELGKAVRVGKFPFQGNGKAIALGEAEGFVKTIFDAKTGELLGAHMIGAEVTELIQGYAVAMSAEATEAELIGTVFPHPTLSEMMHEAVLDAYGRAINA